MTSNVPIWINKVDSQSVLVRETNKMTFSAADSFQWRFVPSYHASIILIFVLSICTLISYTLAKHVCTVKIFHALFVLLVERLTYVYSCSSGCRHVVKLRQAFSCFFTGCHTILDRLKFTLLLLLSVFFLMCKQLIFITNV